ncbi:MAG TPA: DNA polymerase III subunit alpha [Firmicutes bacterium]|nr:DNA polymerase III subunit alpha [Bacillota bacterium]
MPAGKIPFVHLHVHSPWSFMDGADRLEDLINAAARLDMGALALTDHDNVCAAVRFYQLATAAGIKPIQGCEITFAGFRARGPFHLTLLATGPEGYANLCRLLSLAHLENERGQPLLLPAHLAEHAAGLIVLSGCRRGEIPSLLLRGNSEDALQAARDYVQIFGRENFYLELQALRLPRTRQLNAALEDLAAQIGCRTVATNNVHYATPDRFALHDLLTCIRTQISLDDVHPDRPLNGQNWLKSAEEMAALFSEHSPACLAASAEIAARCRPVILPNRHLFPLFPTPPGTTAAALLKDKTYAGAARKYGVHTIPPHIESRLEHELNIIFRLEVEDLFLTVADVVEYARSRRIAYCGRGSSANSAVAYALGISEVDPIERDLLFERFLSPERADLPDIDIDFESSRRDEVIDYVFKRFGRERVAGVCTFSTYQARSAIRDFGKALGFPQEEIDTLAKTFPHMHADRIPLALQAFPELRHSRLPVERYERLFGFCAQAAGFPRHISTHLGGVVVCRHPIHLVSPQQMAAKGIPVIQFDKDDSEYLGLLKLDLLSLRTLSAVRDTLDSLNSPDSAVAKPATPKPAAPTEPADIPRNDPETLAMIDAADTVGIFQLESPAQRALQSMLNIDRMEDIVAGISLIRPGPIRGGMVAPYVRRRQGLEQASYPDPRLKPILDRTYGVVLYQEQVLQIAVAIGGFTPGEADKLRRAMSSARSEAEMQKVIDLFISKAVANGCHEDVARRIGASLAAYSGYGFCQGHAEAFAVTAYRTAYLLRHHPAHFLAALMNNYPLGYYPLHTLCLEARRRGIAVLPPDINLSSDRFVVQQEGRAIRTSLRQVRQVESLAAGIVEEREKNGPYTDLVDFCRRINPSIDALHQLILAGTFDGFDINRRRVFWQAAQALKMASCPVGWLVVYPDQSPGLEQGPGLVQEPGLVQGPDQEKSRPANRASVADFTPPEKIYYEIKALGFPISGHPLELVRRQLMQEGFSTTAELSRLLRADGRQVTVRVAGLVIRPHRPATRSGRTTVFFSLEDEYGLVDVTVFEDVYQRYGRTIFSSPALKVAGHLERRGKRATLTAHSIQPFRIAGLVE